MLTSQASLLNDYFAILVFIHACDLSVIVYLTFTTATFFRLKVINRILKSPENNKNFKINPIILSSFYRLHTATLSTVITANIVCGQVLLAAVIVFPPANAYMTMSLCLGKFKSHVAPVFTVWLFGQLAGQFAIHWVSTLYTVHLHSHTKRLFSLGCTIDKKQSLISQLKHAHYIAKFMVVKRYGITYGSISLISMSSYGKVGKLLFFQKGKSRVVCFVLFLNAFFYFLQNFIAYCRLIIFSFKLLR